MISSERCAMWHFCDDAALRVCNILSGAQSGISTKVLYDTTLLSMPTFHSPVRYMHFVCYLICKHHWQNALVKCFSIQAYENLLFKPNFQVVAGLFRTLSSLNLVPVSWRDLFYFAVYYGDSAINKIEEHLFVVYVFVILQILCLVITRWNIFQPLLYYS